MDIKNEVKSTDKDFEKKKFVVRNAADIQRAKLEKLMKNPEKPVIIPESPRERDFSSAVPAFVRNVMGSSAGAGSGEFHVYRHLRRKEYARQKHIQEKSRSELLDEEFQQKLQQNRQVMEEKTAKNRAKRQKKKAKQKANRGKKPKKEGTEQPESNDEDDSDSDNHEETEDMNENLKSEDGNVNSQNSATAEGITNDNKENSKDGGDDCAAAEECQKASTANKETTAEQSTELSPDNEADCSRTVVLQQEGDHATNEQSEPDSNEKPNV